ncbi:85cae42a-c506-4f60-ba1d-98c73262362a [Sclerotinia trifoliorum]|uniref:85cae42a-c506-4f60-ba1d-98c73262362a n=1 Tax=Sclerotinia trifoliorum TaxID=28548 RepID=A0A8H2VS76_9HELO|nr:85cae42a-c506-4f60-ba1d-98c73262362a [Sclerotinia trifoliorum]
MAQRIVPEMVHYSQQAIFKPRLGLDPNALRVPAPWERVKPVSQHHLLIAAYFDETWTRKVLADEKIGILAKRHMFNPRFEPIIRERIPNKYAFRLDWVLKELADERSSFTMDPSEAEPELNIHEETGTVRINVERKRSSAYIPITSQPFVEFQRSLLRKIEKEFPPSKIIGQKPEGWLRTWSNLPERPSKLFSFPTRGVPSHILNDLEDIRLCLETIGPARVNGFKLMHFKTQRVTQEHKETIIKYYPFKDCLDDYQNRPLFDTV